MRDWESRQCGNLCGDGQDWQKKEAETNLATDAATNTAINAANNAELDGATCRQILDLVGDLSPYLQLFMTYLQGA